MIASDLVNTVMQHSGAGWTGVECSWLSCKDKILGDFYSARHLVVAQCNRKTSGVGGEQHFLDLLRNDGEVVRSKCTIKSFKFGFEKKFMKVLNFFF